MKLSKKKLNESDKINTKSSTLPLWKLSHSKQYLVPIAAVFLHFNLEGVEEYLEQHRTKNSRCSFTVTSVYLKLDV